MPVRAPRGRPTPQLMPGKFLIDLTDARFRIAANEDVMEFVRRVNPFAHTDVGTRLLALGKEIPSARAYCPSYGSCAYVVLHTGADRIFAIAFGQEGLCFRISPTARADALADGGAPAPEIGADWVCFAPWDTRAMTGTHERLRRWCARAFTDAAAAGV